MPVATRTVETQRFPLVTAPPDGYVVLRRLTYGDKLARQGMVSKMRFSASRARDMQGEIDMMTEQTAVLDFGQCIVEHNLTDESGEPLDFKNPLHVKALDGRTGEEIGTYIDRMNSFEEDTAPEGGNS